MVLAKKQLAIKALEIPYIVSIKDMGKYDIFSYAHSKVVVTQSEHGSGFDVCVMLPKGSGMSYFDGAAETWSRVASDVCCCGVNVYFKKIK